MYVLYFNQETAYEMRSSGWSSDVCSSDLRRRIIGDRMGQHGGVGLRRRHVEGAAQRVAVLVVQRDARRAQDAAGEPAAIERVAPRLRIGGIGLDQRQAPGERPDAFLRHQGAYGIADRKSAERGKGVSVRVDLCGSRQHKKIKKYPYK